MIPLLSLGVPRSPPAAMLLGAFMLHGIAPGPMLRIDHPGFIEQITAILLMASVAMWIAGMLLAKQVVKVLRIPPSIFMPIIGVLCIIGSYALGTKVLNLYLMLPVGIIAYFLTSMGYPIAPLVIGVILGPMADSNLRRALMVSKGSFLPVFTRPVALILFLVIVLLVLSQIPVVRRTMARIKNKLFKKVHKQKQN
ncbi:MAG TPA: tripartite tricarboxylate transporter permease, partial [Halalkalibaculum sp.]|nr:tripartite tricarboxylate transporter permease [Halalkalibaculum sp.]